MESRAPNKDDYETAATLLGKIYWEAAARFRDCWGTPSELETHIFQLGENTGVQTILRGEEFIVCYISFEVDPESHELLEELDKNLEPYIGDAKPGALFVNINGENKSIVEHYDKAGFRKDKEALEYTFKKKDWPRAKLDQDIEKRDFVDDDFNDYLWLLDTAYRPVLLEDGLTPDPHRRNLKRTYSVLKSAHEMGDFMAYWKGDSIIGLYLLRDNMLLEIAVAPVYQGMGIGTAILSEILHLMVKERGLDQVLLYVSRSNDIAISLYEKMGFCRTASHADFTHVPPENPQPGNLNKS